MRRVRLPSRDIKVRLNRSGIRVRIPNPNPVSPIVPPVLCEVTYTDDTCVDYTDGTFAEYQ